MTNETHSERLSPPKRDRNDHLQEAGKTEQEERMVQQVDLREADRALLQGHGIHYFERANAHQAERA